MRRLALAAVLAVAASTFAVDARADGLPVVGVDAGPTRSTTAPAATPSSTRSTQAGGLHAASTCTGSWAIPASTTSGWTWARRGNDHSPQRRAATRDREDEDLRGRRTPQPAASAEAPRRPRTPPPGGGRSPWVLALLATAGALAVLVLVALWRLTKAAHAGNRCRRPKGLPESSTSRPRGTRRTERSPRTVERSERRLSRRA